MNRVPYLRIFIFNIIIEITYEIILIFSYQFKRSLSFVEFFLRLSNSSFYDFKTIFNLSFSPETNQILCYNSLYFISYSFLYRLFQLSYLYFSYSISFSLILLIYVYINIYIFYFSTLFSLSISLAYIIFLFSKSFILELSYTYYEINYIYAFDLSISSFLFLSYIVSLSNSLVNNYTFCSKSFIRALSY